MLPEVPCWRHLIANLSQDVGRCGGCGFSCSMNKLFFSILLAIGISAMAQSTSNLSSSDLATITLGAGCFWCVEAVFEAIPGVLSGESGYSGGHIKNPGYREVCTGRTGHAEVVQLTYDVSKVSLADILEVFFATHDPTTPNRQGADVGTQYRSAIYWHNSSQVGVIEQAVQLAQANWPNSIVTEVKAFEAFYPAEDYHQAYYELNKEAPYCRAVIAPKMAKFQKEFGTRFELD